MPVYNVTVGVIGQPQTFEFHFQSDNMKEAVSRVYQWVIDFFGEDAKLGCFMLKQKLDPQLSVFFNHLKRED